MAELLESAVKGDVSPLDLVEWLRCGNCETKNECLKKHEKLRQEFLAYFLNNLRDQCSWIIRSSRRNCQTPCKMSRVSHPVSSGTSTTNEKNGRPLKLPITSSSNDSSNSHGMARFRRELKYKTLSLSSSELSTGVSSETSLPEINDDEKCFSPPNKSEWSVKKDLGRITDVLNISSTCSTHHKFESKLESNTNQVKPKRVPLSSNRGNISVPFHNKCNEFSTDKNASRRNRRKRGGKLIKDNTEPETSLLQNPIPVPDINDLDAFPPVGISVKPTRRITPTAVVKDTQSANTVSPINTLLSENSFSTPRKAWNDVFQSTPLKEPGDVSLQEERELLKKTRNSMFCNSSIKTSSGQSSNTSPSEIQTDDIQNSQHQQSSLVTNTVTPVKKLNELPAEWDTPSLRCVSSKHKLDVIVDIFGTCIEAGLVPNISVELYFIFQILTSRVKKGEVNKNIADVENIFSSIHNCVYIATSVLKHQKYLLELLDRSTLKLLLEVPYLTEFSSELLKIISTLYDKIAVGSKKKLSCIQGVSFQAETDNNKNFTSGNSFHIFRKQRDLFYELFRDWQQQHLTPEWTMKDNFAKRVRNLVSLSVDPANYAHLAKLVQSQLITTCCGGGEMDDSSDEKALSDLKRSFPEKFEKLQERFLAPMQTQGPCPPCSFPGSQSFFHDFLQLAESAALNQHLTDSLAAKIIELNKIEIVYDSEICIDNQLQEQFLNALHTLRLLAKFHGYITFFPYQTTRTIPGDMISSQSALRNHVLPSLDVYGLLQDSIIKQRLILSVPWIVEYLSMMDPVAPFLDYYQNVFVLMFRIYRVKDLHPINPMNLMLIKLMLGWLFETPNFPHSLFFLDKTKNYSNEEVLDKHSTTLDALDSLAVVDHDIIYLCCPYLGDLRILLEEYLAGIRSRGGEVRKITPVSADDSFSSSIATKQMEMQLEENFFHLHPSSLKRTVEFVADRIASRAIRFIRNSLVPSVKQPVIKELKTSIKSGSKTAIIEELKRLQPTITDVALKLCNDIKTEAATFLQTFCIKETEKALPLLMSDEMEPLVIKMCIKISCRIATDTVLQWIKTHVTVAFTHCDVQAEVEKYLKHKRDHSDAEVLNRERRLDEEWTEHSGFRIINTIRNCILEVEAGKNTKKYAPEDILNLIVNVTNFSKSGPQMASTMKTITVLIVDCIIILIVHLPKNCTDEVFSAFVQLCNEFSQCSAVCNIICIRNVQLLSFSHEPHHSWLTLRTLVTKLLENNLLTLNALEDNILTVIKQDWSENILIHFTSCLKGILDDHKKTCSGDDQALNHCNRLAVMVLPTARVTE